MFEVSSFRMHTSYKGVFIATQLNATQLSWTQLTQLNSVQLSQSCFCLWHHDLQTESTVVHAVELSSVELCRYKHPLSLRRHWSTASRLFNAAPDFNLLLLQFVDGVDFCLVYRMLHDSPVSIVNGIEIWTVWRPQVRQAELTFFHFFQISGIVIPDIWKTILDIPKQVGILDIQKKLFWISKTIISDVRK